MGKILSLIFAVTAVLLLIAVGISLSYRELWLALFFALTSVLIMGLGFIIKARLRR